MSSFLLKIAFILMKKTYLKAEPFEYEEAARSLASGGGMKILYLGVPYYAHAHPLYPALCGMIYRMRGNHLAVLLVQVAASTLLGLLVYWLGRKLFSPAAGYLGCLMTLLHPALWVYTTLKLHSLIFDACWFLVILHAFLKLEESFSISRSFFTGLLGGLTCLARSTIGLFILFGVFWVFWQRIKKTSFPYLVWGMSVLLLVTSLTVTPWLVRNEKRLGHWIGIVSTFGLNLWLGNNPHASGSAYTADGKMVLDTMPFEIAGRLPFLTEWEQNALLKEKALDFMRTHPRQTAALFLKKWLIFWWRAPQTGILYPETWKMLYTFYYLMLLGFTAGGMGHAIFSSDKQLQSFSWLILFLFLSVSLTQSLFFVEGRHRWAVEPILLIFSAQGIHLLWGRVRKLCVGSAVKSA